MKSKWQRGAFSGLTKRMEEIRDLWKDVIDLEVKELERRAEAVKDAAERANLANVVSKMNRSELKGRVISDDLDKERTTTTAST